MKLNYLFVLLIISCSFITNINSLKRQPCIAMESDDTNTKSTQPKVPLRPSDPKSVETSKKLAKSCLDNMIKEIKPVFCFQKDHTGRGIGEFPTKCSDNSEISWTECKKKCRDGYYDLNGMCTKKCRSGYEISNTYRCWKSKYDWYLSDRYFREAEPAVCDDGYKIDDSNGRCYRDCAWRKGEDGKAVDGTGLTNCGRNSCVDESRVRCNSSNNWRPSLLNDNVSFAKKILASGKSSDISETDIKNAISALEEHNNVGIRNTYDKVIKALSGSDSKRLRNEIIKGTIKEYEAKKLEDALLENSVKTVCNAVFDNIIKFTTPSALIYHDWSTRIAKNAVASIEDYKKDTKENPCQFGVNTNACIIHLIKTVANVDPSSYISLTTSYSNAECDQGYPLLSRHPKDNGDDRKIYEKMLSMEPGCAILYYHSNFSGKSETICRNNKTGDEGTMYTGKSMSDEITSIIVGPGNDLVVFSEHSTVNKYGRFMEFGTSSYIKQIKDTIDNWKFNDKISGVNFGLAQCAIWQIASNDGNVFYANDGENYRKWASTRVMCPKENPNYEFKLTGIDTFKSTVFNDKLKYTVYEKPNYQGKSKVIDHYTVWDNRQHNPKDVPKDMLGFDQIGSYKLEAK